MKYKPGFQSSLHYHPIKDETMLVVSGEVNVEYRPLGSQAYIKTNLVPGNVIRFPSGTPHRLKASVNSEVFEVSTPHSDDDVVRLEESRKV